MKPEKQTRRYIWQIVAIVLIRRNNLWDKTIWKSGLNCVFILEDWFGARLWGAWRKVEKDWYRLKGSCGWSDSDFSQRLSSSAEPPEWSRDDRKKSESIFGAVCLSVQHPVDDSHHQQNTNHHSALSLLSRLQIGDNDKNDHLIRYELVAGSYLYLKKKTKRPFTLASDGYYIPT